MRRKNITYPKKFYPNYFQIAVTRSEFFFRINFGKLPDTYCIYVSCETLPAKDPCPCRMVFFITFTRLEVFRINWVMFSWQMVLLPLFSPYLLCAPGLSLTYASQSFLLRPLVSGRPCNELWAPLHPCEPLCIRSSYASPPTGLSGLVHPAAQLSKTCLLRMPE